MTIRIRILVLVMTVSAVACGGRGQQAADASHAADSASKPPSPAGPVRAASGDPSCLPYEPETVAIEGKLEIRTFPGRPNYGEGPNDEPENGLYVALDGPVCTRTRPGEEVNEAKTGVQRVQLVVLRDSLWPRVNAVVGTRVHARGRLFSEHSGHHHAPILLTVDSIARVEPDR